MYIYTGFNNWSTYVPMATFIGIRMILDECIVTRPLIFSL